DSWPSCANTSRRCRLMRRDPQNGRRPPGRATFGTNQADRAGLQPNSTTGMSPTEFLAHFEGVRPSGPDSWTAKAHSDQRTGSVAITLLPDGRWLVHDFAGTPTASLLADRGLQLSDLYPTRRSGL